MKLVLFYTGEMLTVNKTLAVIQETGIRTAEVGETVTLRCSCKNDAVTYQLWYQQSLGGKPHLISKRIKHSTKAQISPAFEERFRVIARSSDAGTYHCALASCGAIVFGEGTKVEIVVFPILVYCLSVALALSILALLVLSSLVYKIKLKLLSACKGVGTHQRFSASATAM
ncbi:hypothetical protein ATANTOWER_006966, partial [Ataeniobius toweri]|nr:hypothetical protein [Ataeniobius toweri]